MRILFAVSSVWAAVLLASVELDAASHLWRINEIFSSRDGKVQFIELHECCGATAENFVNGLEVTSVRTGKVFTFPRNVTGSTARKFLLLATPAFAALPGAPQPDFLLPEEFFALDGDTIWYSEARNYDKFTFGPGDLPVDGINSIHVTDHARDRFEVRLNSPANYAGATGRIAVRADFRSGDCNDDGARNVTDAIFLLHGLFSSGGAPGCPGACDANDDGVLDISDAVSVLLRLFVLAEPFPLPLECGEAPLEERLPCAVFASCASQGAQ
jgi:hypothetical protein